LGHAVLGFFGANDFRDIYLQHYAAARPALLWRAGRVITSKGVKPSGKEVNFLGGLYREQEKAMRVEGGTAAVGAGEVVRWLCSDACHDLDDAGVISGLGRRLQSLGLQIDRVGLHLRTLHPQILARSIMWSSGEPVQIIDRESIAGTPPVGLSNPLSRVRQTHEWVIEHSDGGAPLLQWFDVYRDHHVRGFVAAPLLMAQGPAGVAVFATRSAQKFTPHEIELLSDIVPALRGVCEIRQLRRTEATLLDTYVGPQTGRRVLDGHIRRGDVESLRAALFLCDLRDFTLLSNQLPPAQVLDRLNLYFDQVVPAVTAQGGEILKFMGDAVLAFFHHESGPPESCRAAFAAARQALSRIDSVSHAGIPLRAGVALHHGEVAYGNIGSEGRLDFTVIGRDVNLVSRIQTVCGTISHSLLMSPQFAATLTNQMSRSVGRYPLKGFPEAIELFTSDVF
jgi:adenylate cyclase